jgi:hypothetical protein
VPIVIRGTFTPVFPSILVGNPLGLNGLLSVLHIQVDGSDTAAPAIAEFFRNFLREILFSFMS